MLGLCLQKHENASKCIYGREKLLMCTHFQPSITRRRAKWSYKWRELK